MGDDSIGSVSVQIVGDYSRLSSDFRAAQGEAQKAGQSIASSFTRAVSDTSSLETTVSAVVLAINRLNATLTSTAGAQNQAAGAANSHTAALRGQLTTIQAISGELRVLEGAGSIRAAERLLTLIPGIGAAAQLVFPAFGAIAVAEVFDRGAKAANEFFEKIRNAPEQARGSFRGLNDLLQDTNDGLALSNARLDDQIAKLQGHPTNGLKVMLEEIIVAADKLSEALEKDITKLATLLKEQSVGGFTGFLGATATSDKFAETLTGVTGLAGKLTEISKIREEGNSKIRNAASLEEANVARTKTRADLERVFNSLLEDRMHRLQALEAVNQGARPQASITPGGALPTGVSGVPPTPIDTRAEVEKAKAAIDLINREKQRANLEFENIDKQQTKGALEHGRDAAAAAKKAGEEWLSAQRDILTDTKLQHAVSASEEEQFWTVRLPEAQQKYPNVVRQVQQDIISARTKGFAELKRANEEDLKAFEQMIREQRAAAEQAGNSPNAIEVQLRQRAIQNPSEFGLRPEMAEAVAGKVPEAQERSLHDLLESVKRTTKEIETDWDESSGRTAIDVKNNLNDLLIWLEQLRTMVPGVGTVIDEVGAKFVAASRKVAEERAKAGAVGRATDLDAIEGANAQKKIALESAYGLQAIHTAEQQIQYARELGAIELDNLQAKLQLAQIALEEAMDEENVVKMAEAHRQAQQAQLAIALQQMQVATQIQKITHDSSFGGMIDKGLTQTGESVINRMASGIANLTTESRAWGKEFQAILKDIEHQLVETFAKAALKQGANALLGAIMPAQGSAGAKGGGEMGVQGGMEFLNALTANTTATTADTTASQALTSGIGSLVGGLTSGLGSGLGGLFGGLGGLFSIFGFASGGRPPVGVPSVVGENGPEWFIPDRPGYIANNQMVQQLMASAATMRSANVNLSIPEAPRTFGGGASSDREQMASMLAGMVTNHNTGQIGDNHFNIYGDRNPRETMRQIADYQKRQTGKFSPANS